MGKRIGKVDHKIWERTSNEKKTAGWTKSSHDKVATRTWQPWKKYDAEERQKERIVNKKTIRTREVSLISYIKYTVHFNCQYFVYIFIRFSVLQNTMDNLLN